MARPKLGSSETERLHIKITADEIRAIDDWRYANRVPSRSEAVRRLVQIGLLVEDTLEGIVDYATEGVRHLVDEMADAVELTRALSNDQTTGMLFTSEEIRDVLTVSGNRALNAVEAVEGIQQMILALYNAIAPLAEAATLEEGSSRSKASIEDANRAVEELNKKRKEIEENRYIGIIATSPALSNWKRHYDALPETEKETVISDKIVELAKEEDADPEAFARKYGTSFFWEKEGWWDRLQRASKDKGEE